MIPDSDDALDRLRSMWNGSHRVRSDITVRYPGLAWAMEHALGPAKDVSTPAAGPVTHIAGLRIEAIGFIRQRCAWCAHMLIDYDLRRVAVPEGQDAPLATFEPGVLVETDGSVSVLIPGDQLPDNACAVREAGTHV